VIIGVGIDVVDVERFGLTLLRTPAMRQRLFTAVEQVLPLGSLAGRFAAKEALAKALGAPAGMAWTDAEVTNDPDGRAADDAARLRACPGRRARSSHLAPLHLPRRRNRLRRRGV
jgi:phosphopantetheine--protein transferase-like protein